MSKDFSKSQVLRSEAERIAKTRAGLLEALFEGGSSATHVARLWSKALDRFFRKVLKSFDHDDWALLALGSYGRRSLSFSSDVDCLLLCRNRPKKRLIEALSEGVRCLWDVNVTARVASYSIKGASRLARQDLRVFAALLDQRVILGNKALLAELSEALDFGSLREGLRQVLAREDQKRISNRYLDLYAAEPDLKTSQGGLRDLAAISWLSRKSIWTSYLRVSTPLPLQNSPSDLKEALEPLLLGRFLLYRLGYRGTRLTREAMEGVERLGVPGLNVDHFCRQLAVARRLIYSVLKPLLYGRSAESLDMPKTPKDLLETLSRPDPSPILEALLDSSALFSLVPGLERALGVVPGDDVHAFTLDRHLVLTACKAAEVLDRTQVPYVEALQAGQRARRELLLAALLHDIGRVGPPPHFETSSQVAKAAALKMGLGRKEAQLVSFLCRHHMELPEASCTLDFSSPTVALRLAQEIGSRDNLDLLFILGLADMRALGPQAPSAFREELLIRAWQAVRTALFDLSHSDPFARRAERRRKVLYRHCQEEPLKEVVALLPQSLLLSLDIKRLCLVVGALREVKEKGPKVFVEAVGGRAKGHPSTIDVTFVGIDERGLLSRLSGALTSLGLSIEEARIFTLPNGLVVDHFRALDPSSGSASPQELSRRLLEALTNPDLPNLVRRRLLTAFRPLAKEMVAEVDNTIMPGQTVIRVAGPDRPGLLHLLTDLFYREGLDITGAIVMTEGSVARDTFFVRTEGGAKVEEPEKIRRLLRVVAKLGEE